MQGRQLQVMAGMKLGGLIEPLDPPLSYRLLQETF